MVTFSTEERAAITSTWTDVNLEELGQQGLARMMIVYPWTRIHFSMFGNISDSAAILANPQIRALGKKVTSVLSNVVMNLNDVKGTVTGLAKWHADNVKVDPEHFRLLFETFQCVLAMQLGAAKFTPDAHAAWSKLFAGLTVAFNSQLI